MAEENLGHFLLRNQKPMPRLLKVVGIDVGLTSGAAAIYGYDGGCAGSPRLLTVFSLPTIGEDGGKRIDVPALQEWLRKHSPDIAYIENATAMPSQPDQDGHRRSMGAGTMARYLRACGAIEATVACCGVQSVLIMPAVWKRAMKLSGPNKQNSVDLIRSLCPEHAATWFKFKKSHNLAEAALLSIYGASRVDMIELK